MDYAFLIDKKRSFYHCIELSRNTMDDIGRFLKRTIEFGHLLVIIKTPFNVSQW